MDHRSFTTKPGTRFQKGKVSIWFGEIFMAYADNQQEADALIATFTEMYNRGYDAAQLQMRRALGVTR